MFNSHTYPTGQIVYRMGTLRNSILSSSSTLRYLNGNCTWTVALNLGTVTAEFESVGPEQMLQNSDAINEYRIKCEVNDTLILDAEVTILGEFSCS